MDTGTTMCSVKRNVYYQYITTGDTQNIFAKAAEELHNSFDEKAHKIQQIVENTQETEADDENTATQTEMDWKDREMMKESKRQSLLENFT